MRSQAFQRGQTLVLAALSLLLLTLLVCMTLSFGSKLKEKMEVETVADAAAYSNAVETARVFNEISLMNRAQTSQMAAMAAVQSLVSWAGYHRAQLAATKANYGIIAGLYGLTALACCIPYSPCMSMCVCANANIAKITTTIGKITTEESRIAAGWDGLDQAAGAQMRAINGVASAFAGFEGVEYGRLMFDIGGQSLAGNVVSSATTGSPWASEWSAPSGADSVNMAEIMPVTGAMLPPFLQLGNDHMVSAAMGTRGWSFETSRGGFLGGGAAGVITARLNTILAATPDVVVATDDGSSYWAGTMNHATWPSPSGGHAWGDDHGMNEVTFLRTTAPCPPYASALPATAFLEATDSSDTPDYHQWLPADGPVETPAMAQSRHQLVGCAADCPGMWPLFLDYNEVRAVMSGDVFGQPKNYAVIVRDYGARPARADPWDLFFNFRLTPGGQSFDDRGLFLGAEGGGQNISKQVALATGIAYYHRSGDHWKEPPNCLNPWWRATLVPLNVDSTGGGTDPDDALNGAGANWTSQTYDALKSAGFRGWP